MGVIFDSCVWMALVNGQLKLAASVKQAGRSPRPRFNDLWIAASALELGAALLTRDAHFGHIDGLRSGRSLEDFLP